MTAAVRLVEVTKLYGAMRAVDSLTLDIAEGEFLTLLGPSGCGKTTTLRLISGFEIADEGLVMIGGQPVNQVPPYRRNVNTVFQSYALFPHMTVFDNVAYGLTLKRLPKATIRSRVETMLERVGLPHKATSLPRQLSGGQMQRIALARALINEPKVLLLDEPLGALDAQLRKSMQLELKEVHRTLGITFVYVTHDQEEALVMSDRIAVMNEGRIVQLGSPEAIFESPVSRFVAEFMGTSSFLQATAGPSTPQGRHLLLEGGLVWQSSVPPAVPEGSRLTLALRPQKLRILPAGTSGGEAANATPATVREVVYVGAFVRVLAALPGGQVVAVEDLPDRLGLDYRALQPGQAIRLAVPPEALLHFRES